MSARAASAALLLCATCLLWSSPAAARRALSQPEIKALIGAIRDGPVGARNRAVQRLFHLRDRGADRALLALASDERAELAVHGLWALSIARPRGARALLIRRARGAKATAVRVAALRSLGLLAAQELARGKKRVDKRVRAALSRALRDRAQPVRRASIRALARLGPAGLWGLRRALGQRARDVRLLALSALGAIKGARARALLRRRLGRGSAQEQLEAARQLRRRAARGLDGAPGKPAQGAERALCRLARRSPRGVRLQAVELLGRAPAGGCATATLARLARGRGALARAAHDAQVARRRGRRGRREAR